MANVLITGCSSGFGLLIAQTFARNGHTVFATVRDVSTSNELRQACDAESLPLSILPLDVRDTASVNAAVGAALDGGPIDVLVNNAGFALRGPVEEVADDELLGQFDTNVFGVVRTIRAVIPAMREQGAGTIVNVSSIVASVPPPFSGIYAASKAALNVLSHTLHYELAPFGIRVVLVEPGPYPTRLNQNQAATRRTSHNSPYAEDRGRFEMALARLTSSTPSGDPQEVADAIHTAATDNGPQFVRLLLGSRARQLETARNSMDFEAFAGMFRNMLNWPLVRHSPSGGSMAAIQVSPLSSIAE